MTKVTLEEKKNMFDGEGSLWMERILNQEQFHGMGRLFSRMTLKKGCSLGYHVHEGESETYFVLSGEAECNDNGVIKTIRAGDVTYTPSGTGHALINKNNEDFVFMALILFDEQQ